LLLTTLCLSGVARSQSGGGSVTASGVVRGTVALSFEERAETYAEGVRVASAHNEGGTLVIAIYGSTSELTRVNVHILIRSNTAYRLLAAAKADGANLAGLSVAGARPTGALVAADAVEALTAADVFDAGPGVVEYSPAGGLKRLSLSTPLELLSGPRISLGGTVGSPLNALEVTISASVEPRADGRAWAINLHLKPEPAEHL
ncbi:MAG TPA: hypothetical protein VF521_19290, partial [Pyrinomonadaceae bacterium]